MVAMRDPQVRAILLDIEGTTTPVDFVYQVLFPYARRHLREFIARQHAAEAVRADLARLRAEQADDASKTPPPPAWRDEAVESELESAAAYALWLMDQDRKSTGLKSLQGKIWEAGYRRGELRGQVYEDVPPALARWMRQQKSISIFSSGSVLAQQLLFAHTTAGDLTPWLRSYFDTTTGAKHEAESYRRIAAALELPPAEILFLSDVAAELDAAQRAGMQTALCVRAAQPPSATSLHPIIHTFDQVFP
jgi:enolase-phosphatase E1